MKKIALWLLTLALTFAGLAALSGCQFIENDSDDTLYVINTDEFNSTVVYGESVSLDGLKIVQTKEGVTTEIPVNASMITAPADVNRVGVTEMKVTYDGHEFSVQVSVKYRVTLKADGEIIETLYVMTAAELASISAPEKAGYIFDGWNPEIPGTLTENITLEAKYIGAAPALTELKATYGDKLGDLTLPSTTAGKWVFNTPDNTVGDAGKREAAVSFVLNSTGEVLKTDVVKINVAKRTVNFTDISKSLVYNGEKQIPTYTADANVNIVFYEESGFNYTDAGIYPYYFEVNDPNYEGELEGTYEITKASVTIKIGSYTILASEKLPEITYEILGFENESILGLSVTDPEDVVNGAGVYTLTATVSNPNVDLTVENGTLTVISTVLDVGAPQLSSSNATYGDKLSTLTFETHHNGRWAWQTPDAEVGNVGTRTHVAVFTPNDPRYDTLTYNVDITVNAKPLNIEIPDNGNVFTYDGTEKILTYVIKDDDGNVYDLEVLGNTPFKDAGTYDRTLTFANNNYTSNDKKVNIVVHKANPTPTFSTELNTVWSSTLKLMDIQLPAGCEWLNPDAKVENAGETSHDAIYTHEDTKNYNPIQITFTVTAEKATATINNVNNSYSFTYTGSDINLSGISASHEESELSYAYTLDGVAVSAIKNVGTYTVTITLEGTTNYKAATATTTVTVSPASNTDDVMLYQKATYGDKLSVLKLPSSEVGTWSWKNANANTTVGNAGENKFTAIFTPANGNYNSREVIITVTVDKKKIDAPSIAEEMRRQAYTGDRIYSGLINSEGYTVTDDGGISKGTYTATLVLDTTNYVWSDGSSESKTLTYEIVEAANEWTSAPTIKPSWTYGDTAALDKNSDEYKAYLGSATAKYGTVTITYALAGTDSFSAELPTDAGKYIARFTAIHTDAATKSEDVPFEILKKAVDIPSYTGSYVYTGTGVNAGISATELYDVADELRTDAGSYTAKLTLRYPSNYVWADGDTSASKNLPYTISKANAVIEDFTIGNVKFGESLDPTATVSLGAAYKFLYSTAADGEYTATAPTAVGTYFVKVSVTGNENVNASESAPIEFAINKADVTISGYQTSYEKTYDTNVFAITGVTASNGAEVKFSVKKDGIDAEMLNAGTYTVIIYTEETESYNASSVTVTVTVKAADNTDTVKVTQSAVYGDKLATLELPSSDNGTWSWKDADENTTVGNAGENKFTAIFTPATENYNAREVEITVTVAKKKIDVPTISEAKREQAYTGSTLTSGLLSGEGYTVLDECGISVGTYRVTLSLDTANYVWSDGSSEDKTLTYKIVEAANEWTVAPTIKPSWVFGDTDALDKNSEEYKAYLGSAAAKYGTVTVTYALVGSGSFSSELPTDAGKYVARFTATDPNAIAITEDVSFEISKKAVTIPSYTDTYVYTGTGIKTGIAATELYSVIDEPRTDAGTYYVRITLLYPSNYVWADGDTATYKNLPFTISKATASITDFTVSDVKFGEALAPTATVSLGAAYRFIYSDTIDGAYSATAPTAVGTYFVKVSVTGNENVNASESAPIEFAINKADVTISGYQTSYEKTYDTNVFAITGVTASNGAEVKFSVKKDGIDAEMLNAGTYTVIIYTEETESYNASSVTVTVTVKAADNTDTVKLTQNATYGDKLSTLELPSSDNGTWSWKDATEDTTVGNAGENKFTAVFTPATENYNAREVEVTVTVQKATVDVPNPSHSVYDGELHNSGITENEFYTVVDEGGYDKGTYTVTLTLKNSANYKWDNSADATIYVEYSISEAVNGWTTEPSVKTPVEYGDTDSLASAEANYGDVLIEYKEENEDDSKYTTIAPTLPGKYLVRFTTTDENYTKLTTIKSLEITKKKITAPTVTVTKFVYTGEKITLGLAASDYYTVSDEGSTNAASSIVATITLNSEYYVWADGTEGLTKEYTYSVIPATNSVSTPTVDGWTYGEEANAPTDSSDSFGCEIYYVYSSTENGEYTAAVPTNAGTYYVKAIAKATANVNVAESSPVAFTIAKAQASIEGYEENYTQTYNGTNFTFDDKGIAASNGATLEYAITKDGENVSAIKNAGVYTVNVTLPESANYLGDEVAFTVTINKVVNTDTIPTYTATYGDKLSTLAVPSSVTGDWKWKDITDTTTVGDAGNREHTLVFTPDDEANYESREVTVTVTVAKATISTPAPLNPTNVYANVTHTSGLTSTDLYTVEDAGGVNVGTYSATLTLTDSSNYAWDDPSNESATTTVTYTVTEGTNEITSAAIGNWTYGEAGNAGSATAKYGDIVITYKAEGENDDKYSSTLPTNAGNYVARFTTTDANCPAVSVTRTFTILKKAVTVPKPESTELVYTGSVITLGFAADTYYSVTDEGGTNVGDYYATVTLLNENYEWADGDKNLAKEFSYSIVKANVTFTNLTLNGWTYGGSANIPTVSTNFVCNVYFLYSDSTNGEYTATTPVNAGTYYVKAVTDGNSNLNKSESSPVAFTIAKAQASIEGYEENYTQTYNGTNFTFDDKGIAASNGATLEYAITKDGENVSAIKNAGVYTVNVTLPESANYLGDEVAFTVTINKVVNTDTIPTYTATYGDKLSTLAVPSSVTGDWKWKDITDTTTVGDAGNREHTLVFTPDDEANYESREVTVTVTVAKATISTPAPLNPTNVYANVTHTSGLTSTDLYTVEDAGGVNVGTYSATLTLTDSSNYAWDDPSNESATTTVTYTVTEGTNEITSAAIGNWTYGEAGNAGSATAKYGDIVITYKAEGENDDKYSSTLPTNAGNYVARFTTTDTNCPAVSVTRTFTIEPATVNAPTASDVYYNGEVQTGGISNNEFYTVIGEGGVNVGDYSITVTLTDKNNYKWNTTGNSSDITLNYKILKTTVTLSGLSAGWTYDNPQEPTVTVSHEFAKQYVTFLYSADGGSTWSTEKPTAVGTYKVKATIAETSNYTADDREADFTIDRATPTFAAPYFANGTHYQNLLDLSTSGFKAYNNGKEISGSFSFGDVVFADGAGASSVTLTFTPEDTTNYKPVTETYNMTLVSVAYLNNTVAYGTIEDAIIAANAAGGGTVWVRPDTSGNVIIKNDITIYETVTLAIAFGTDDSGRNIPADDGKIYATLTDDGDGNSDTDYINGISLLERKTCVTLAAGTVITNYGTIEVSGELGAPGGGVRWTCHTVRYYAELLMEDGSQIISKNNSSIICCGFITETSTDNGSTITLESGASMCQPFTMHDYRGGSYMAAVYKVMSQGYSAFNMYEFRNVSSKLIINYGGAFKALVNLYASSKMNAETVTMVGSDSNAVIQLNSVNSYLVAKRNPETKICDINIYGGAQTNGLVIAVDSSTKIDTSTSYFPVPYYFNITLNDNGNNAQYHLNQDFKFLTGSKLVVGEGVTLYAKKLMFYETFDDPCTIPGKYPTGLAPAEFILKGSATIAQFGGIITAGSDSASLKITTGYSITTREVIKVSGKLFFASIPSDGYKEITFTAKLKNSSDSTLTDLSLGLGLGRYFVEDGQWNPTTITFDSDGGSTVSSIHITGDTYPTLPTPTKQDYLFLGWFCDGTLVQSGEALLSMKSHTLTASWRRLTKITLTPDMDGFEAETVYVDSVASGIYPTLPTLENVGYTFLGWFYGDVLVQSGEALKTTDDHVLTAQWRRNVFVTLDSTFDDVADTTVYVDSVASGIYPTLPTLEKVGYTFLGWFYGETQVQSGEALKTTDDHVLTAKWSRQIVVNLDSGVDDIADSVIYVNSGDGAVYPTLPTLEKEDSTFLGWFYGETQVSNGYTLPTTDDHTLVAKWRARILVTFDSGFDDVEDSLIYVDAVDPGTYPELPTPTKEGYVFVGWEHEGTQATAGAALIKSESHTLTAIWKALTPIGLDADGDGTADSYVYVDIVDESAVYPTLAAPADKTGHTFAGWTYNGVDVAAGQTLEAFTEHTLVAKWTVNSYTVTVTTSAATVTGVANGDSIPYGTEVSITVTFNKSIKSLVVKDAAGNKLLDKTANGTYTFIMPASAVTITAKSEDGCVTADTLVTLADGAQKRIDSVTSSDMLLVWNFFEGKYDSVPAAILFNHGYASSTVIKLNFSDGTSVKVVNLHQFLSAETNSFVEINSDTVESLVGHSFIKQNGDGTTTVELVDYSITEEYVEAYGIISAFHYNIIVEGLISTDIMPEDQPLFNYFEIGDDMRFDEEKMQSDIEKYGLYTYEDFAENLTYEQFVAFNIQYMKISVGKGAYTYEGILDLIDYYLNK